MEQLVRFDAGLFVRHDERWRRLSASLDEVLALSLDEVQGLIGRAISVEVPEGVPLAPIQSQEVWAAGVTYQRSLAARAEEAVSADPYERVYSAERPELFFKATAGRVRGPGETIHIRSDSTWDVPEPELAVVCNSRLEVVGYTIGNDVSSRSIEGENALYLPQAKVYDGCCALGPAIALAWDYSPVDRKITLEIRRADAVMFWGETSTSALRRSIPELLSFLGRDQRFPVGCLLLTGTGIVPPSDVTLRDGDVATIRIDGIGELVNPVRRHAYV
ncbi:MAG TPA: fumarylacetoacetate hydrolase family protein [Candidatus Dormibacteraeota bacterium]|nr:fumarylacetoacetate hydrolase family protein [Candidatus Dormibacteraeota bacterium]